MAAHSVPTLAMGLPLGGSRAQSPLTLAELVTGPIQFDVPHWLLLVPILGGLAWFIGRKSLAGLGPTTRWIALGIRLVVIAAIAGALAEPRLRKEAEDVAVTVVLDVSRSIPPSEQRRVEDYIDRVTETAADRRTDRLGVVTVAREAYVQALPNRLLADLSRLPSGKPEPIPAPEPATIQGRHVTIVEKPGPSTAISFGVPIDVLRGSREWYALAIASSWLGEHRNSSSHLYQVIREARGMNYGDYSYIEAYPNGGSRTKPPTGVGRRQQLFEVWIRPVPEHQALFALRAALREVELLVIDCPVVDQGP